jgi:bifunctional non-homologous end joining protein LigD
MMMPRCAFPAPPDGESWLHEIKHDGHRLIAIVDGGGRLSLVSRNGYERTEAFGAPFAPLIAAGRKLVIDGEIAVPDRSKGPRDIPPHFPMASPTASQS